MLSDQNEIKLESVTEEQWENTKILLNNTLLINAQSKKSCEEKVFWTK